MPVVHFMLFGPNSYRPFYSSVNWSFSRRGVSISFVDTNHWTYESFFCHQYLAH